MKTCTVGYNKKCVVLTSGNVRLAVATDKGPRVVGCFIGKGSKQNMFAELPPTPMPEPANGYCLYGGHRLWHSPEDCPLCYEPDNDPVEVGETDEGVCFTGAVAESTGIRKSIEIQPLGEGYFRVIHTLENRGIWPLEFAPWTLTMMAPGGVTIIPQGYEADGFPYAPDRKLVVWPYTDLADKRLKLGTNYIFVRNDPKVKKPLKIGFYGFSNWIGYANFGNAFAKFFDLCPDDRKYTDMGCSVETYVCDVHSEIEALGTLEKVGPGESITHQEIWVGLEGIGDVKSEKDVRPIEEAASALSCECDDEECDCCH